MKSTDHGQTYGDTLRIDQLSEGFAQYPDIVAQNDTVFVTFMAYNDQSEDPQYVVARSYDGGASFSTAVDAGAILNAQACECCQPEIVMNDSYLIVLMRNNDNDVRDIHGIVSTDRGQSFSSILYIDGHQWVISGCPSTGPDARLTDDETLLSAYRSFYAGIGKLYVSEYDIAGDSLKHEVNLTNAGGDYANYPQVYYEQNTRAVVYEGIENGMDVFLNVWEGSLTNLDTANTINLSNYQGSQNKADVAIHNSRVHFVYMDSYTGNVQYGSVDASVGISESAKIPFIELYPNPAGSGITVVSDKWRRLTLRGLDGQAISQHTQHMERTRIDLTGMPGGIYMLELLMEDGSMRYTKFVKLP